MKFYDTEILSTCFRYFVTTFHKKSSADIWCSRHIEMTSLCKIEVTLPRVLGSREVRRGGGVDERAGVQPA